MNTPKFDISYNQLPTELFATAQPDATPDAQYVWRNDALADQIDIGKNWLNSHESLDFFTGNTELNYTPLAMAYSGHQFGHLSPRLGDGRALLIGEYVAQNNTRYDVGLKGSGRTDYSRSGDGKSTLRAALKEAIFSEYLAAINIPTSRSLAAYTTGETVMRETPHQGAVLVRIAKSFIRVGTFQFAGLLNDDTSIKHLADFLLAREYPTIDTPSPKRYQLLFAQIVSRQASLIAHWMSQGFIHGVMNTDNMALSGETIDFGPCAFMESFKPDQTFSSIDQNSRYAWNKQADIGIWNLTRLAEVFLPLFDDDQSTAIEVAQNLLSDFSPQFMQNFNNLLMTKLGLPLKGQAAQDMTDQTLLMLSQSKPDFTLFFRRLSETLDNTNNHKILSLCENPETASDWLTIWQNHVTAEKADKAQTIKNMNAANPIYIPRLHLVETALNQANNGDMSSFHHLNQALQNPYTEKPEFADFLSPANPDQAQNQTFCET